jgi:membrane fusion protein, multidrug efflux system
MPGVPVTVAKAVETSVPVEVRAIGNVEAWSSIQVKSQVAGILTRADFTEGQEVHKGQLLFEIDPRPYKEAYNQAAAAVARDQAQLQQAQANQARDEAQFRNAEVLANRYAELLKEGVVSKEQNESYSTTADMQRQAIRSDQAAIAQSRAAIEADGASLSAAQLNLEFCRIQSPIDGRTGNLAVKEGNLVKAQADNALVTINQIEPVYVTFSVPEAYLPDIRRFSAQGKLQVEAYIGQDTVPVTGELSFIDNSVNAATGAIQIKGTFRNLDRRLWPGEFVNVVLRLATAHNVIIVPSEAIQTGQQGQFAFVISTGTAQIRPIKVGQAAGRNTVVESGLAAGETVVTDGQLLLAPGAPVRIVKTAADSAAGPGAP